MTLTARGMEGVGSIDIRAGVSRRAVLLGAAPSLLVGTAGATACGASGTGGGSGSAPPRPGTLKPAVFPVARIGEARTQAKGKWDLAVAPQGPAGKGKRLTTGGGVAWYQAKAFAHQEEAWALIQHLTSSETALFLSDVRIPGRKAVLDKWLALNPGEAPKSRSVAKTGQEAVHIDPVFPLWDRIEREAFTPLLTLVWNNQATPRDAAREITAQANRILAEAPR